MRLLKVQKALNQKGIKYEYEEHNGLARMHFVVNGTGYDVDELRGNRGASPTGIWTDIEGINERGTQDRIVEFIKTLHT